MKNKIYLESDVLLSEHPNGKLFEDKSGRRYGRLIVIGYHKLPNCNQSYWFCKCDCGNIVLTRGSGLNAGVAKSCGCLIISKTKERFTKHGQTSGYKKSPEYNAWGNMLRRTKNTSCPSFRDYGERGITVCDRWAGDFKNFLADMGERPSNKHSLDRIDNSKGYSPENCRWATQAEQQNNRRSNRYISYGGKRLTISQWESELGFKRSTIRNRLKKGWDIEKCLSPLL